MLRGIWIALLIAGATFPSWAQPRVLRWAHGYEATENYHLQAVRAAEEVLRQTQGRIKIEVFPASQLGGEETYGPKLLSGELDIAYVGSSYASKDYPRVGISGLPFVFLDTDHVRRYLVSPLCQEILDGYQAKMGNHIVSLVYYGARHVTANRLLRTPQDMVGLRLRVPGAPNYMLFAKSMGAQVIPISFPKVYEALKNGEVDAQENPLPTIMAKKFYEVQKFTFLTAHIYDLTTITIGGPTWKSLGPDDQKIVDAAIRKAASWVNIMTISNELVMESELRKRGMIVLSVDRKAFKEASLRNAGPADLGLAQQDYERVQALAARNAFAVKPEAEPAAPAAAQKKARAKVAEPTPVPADRR